MVTILIIEVFIIGVTLMVIGYPLFSKDISSLASSYIVEDDYKLLLAKKDMTYSALKDIAFDYNTGKLSEEDYIELKNQYEMEAISILQEIDRQKEMIRQGKKKKDNNTSKITANSLNYRINYCPRCGHKIKHGDAYCANCGNRLNS